MTDVPGVFDLHVHSSPDLFPRIADDIEIVTDAAKKGFAGIVMKNHFESTASRAVLAGRAVSGTKVYGSIVLNRYVGGINPHAVEVALRMGAKIIWMPTLDADQHIRAFGFAGGFPAQSSGLETPARGISLLRESRLIDEAREIVALVKQHGGVLATGHISVEEINALIEESARQSFTKLVLTHPYDRAPGLSFEQVLELAKREIRIEFVFCSITPNWKFTDARAIAHCMKAIGPSKCLISSDGGQVHNPMPADGYRTFVELLGREGLTKDDFRVMCRENADYLLHG